MTTEVSFFIPDDVAGAYRTSLDWMENGVCNAMGRDNETFVIKTGASNLAAKAMCHQCVMLINCLDYALEQKDTNNTVWGGLSGSEREKILALRRENKPEEEIQEAIDAIWERDKAKLAASEKRARKSRINLAEFLA